MSTTNYNHKKFSKKKKIVAINISDAMAKEKLAFTSMKEMAKELHLSYSRLKRIVNTPSATDYIRSSVTGKLWQITYDFDNVVRLHPLFVDPQGEAVEDKEFVSVYRVAQFLGVSRTAVYNHYDKDYIGKAYPKPIKDVFEREWDIIFLKEIGVAPDEINK